MGRQQLIDMAKRNLAHVEAGTLPLAPDVFRVPAKNYYDPARWQLEIERIFKRMPLTLAFTAELANHGDYKAMDVAGVPVLISRGADGVVRAFVNMCSHRGSIVVTEGLGNARRFSCPYHAWTYDQQGALVGILDRQNFGDVDESCLGLTALPAAERAGMIFVGLTPGEALLGIEDFLCGYGDVLTLLGLADCHLMGSQAIPGPNWKIAYDGYLDLYHLPILHRNTFGSDISNQAFYDSWGPHQRVTSPSPALSKLRNLPEADWPIEKMNGGVWTTFPHVSIASFESLGKVYMVSQLFPGPDADSSVTVQTFLHTKPPTPEREELMAKTMEFLHHVVADEDYYTGLRIQRAAKTGTKKEFLFGRNEGGGQRFHRFLDDLLATEDADLPALFARL